MSKESKNMIVPKLRFADFRDDGEWLEKRLGEIGEPLMCKRIFKEQTTANPQNAIPFYKIGTFGREADSYISIDLYNDYKSKYSFPTEGDILISASGTIGRLVVYDGADAYFQDSNIVWLKNNEKSILNRFLFYCYSILRWQTSDGGVIQRLYNSDLKNIKIRYPQDLSEQQKIASCLSSLDDLITAENQKLEALKAHKKGLMQQLFPAEGEITPKFRFAEFRGSGEWELLEIKSKVESISGYPFLGSDISEDNSGVPLLRGINITEGYIRHNIDIDRYFLGDVQNLEKFKLETNDLVIGMDGSKVGKNSALITNEDAGSLLIQRVARLRSKQDAVIQFIFQQINSNKFHSYVDKINTSGGIPHISLKQIESFEISFPPTIEEQRKIATCLSSLDEFITSQAEKIEGLKEHKKGLMQGLFPFKK